MLSRKGKVNQIIILFACWFQSGLISQSTVLSSHIKPALSGLISPETNQQTGSMLTLVLILTLSSSKLR